MALLNATFHFLKKEPRRKKRKKKKGLRRNPGLFLKISKKPTKSKEMLNPANKNVDEQHLLPIPLRGSTLFLIFKWRNELNWVLTRFLPGPKAFGRVPGKKKKKIQLSSFLLIKNVKIITPPVGRGRCSHPVEWVRGGASFYEQG